MGTKVYGSQVFWGGYGILEMTLTDGAYTYSFVLPPARLRTAVAEPATSHPLRRGSRLWSPKLPAGEGEHVAKVCLLVILGAVLRALLLAGRRADAHHNPP